MIDWNNIVYEDIVILATIAASYNMGINEMLHHLNLLDEEQRGAVQAIAEKHAAFSITSQHDEQT